MNLQQLMKQAQSLQKKLKEQQDALASKEYEGQSGGSLVLTRMSGEGHLLSLSIKPEAVDTSDLGLLEDLVVAAVNDAVRKMKEDQQSSMAGTMGGLKIPGLF
jgi:hypothetical protein